MWTARGWKDYEILDTSGGEKLERWGSYVLRRPDPQVIWNTPKEEALWGSANARYHRSARGGGEWEFFDLPAQWQICYDSPCGRLVFHLKPFNFKHTGLFPEQAVNWDWFVPLIQSRAKSGREVKVLNLFAYTGAATCAASKAGAHTTHVDSSRGIIGWAKENAASCGVSEKLTRWIADDCRKFAEREIRRGNRYDAVIMDPPSYGRGPKGEIWKMEDDVFDLMGLCANLLCDDPLFFLVNSYTTGLQSSVLSYMLSLTVKSKFGGRVSADEVGLCVSRTGLVLPCGAAGRWQR